MTENFRSQTRDQSRSQSRQSGSQSRAKSGSQSVATRPGEDGVHAASPGYGEPCEHLDVDQRGCCLHCGEFYLHA